MKRTRRSGAAANKPPPAKRPSNKSPAQGAGTTSLGVSEEQLGRIMDRVGQSLSRSVAAEVLTALSGTETALGGKTPSSDGQQGGTAPVTTPQGEQADETTISALVYGESDPKPPPMAATSYLPLAYHVSDKLRDKITNHKYVDFKHLLPGNADPSYTLRLDSGRGDPTVHLASTTPVKPISSIDPWLSAFTTYQFLFTQAHPQAAPDLLKYLDTVRDLQHRFGFQAARYYDENFRLLRERAPEISFAATHSELWLKAATLPAPQNHTNQSSLDPSSSPRSRQLPPSAPKGHCYAYNTMGKWCNNSPCKYLHICSNCQGSHPQFSCRQSTAPRANPVTPRGSRGPAPATTPSPNPTKTQ